MPWMEAHGSQPQRMDHLQTADQAKDLLYVSLARYLEGGPMM